MPRKSDLYMPTAAEDAEITAAALSDPDAQPLTDEELDQMVPLSIDEVFAIAHGKVAVSLFLEPALVAAFTAVGADWRTHMGDVLADWARARNLL